MVDAARVTVEMMVSTGRSVSGGDAAKTATATTVTAAVVVGETMVLGK